MTTWPIDKLYEWDKNPRSISKDGFERLKKQIEQLGQYKPLVITNTGEILGGNMRYKAYKALGIKDIWVSVVSPKDDNEKLAYALSDNDRAGFYDEDLLANLTADYPDFAWDDFAVDLKEPVLLSDLMEQNKEVEEDEVPPLSDEPAVSEYGKVYQLGRHRLMCGDATKIEDVERLMDGQKADMVFTDPPYNVAVNDEDISSLKERNRRTDGLIVSNDNMTDEEFNKFLFTVFSNYYVYLKDGGVIYICYADSMTIPFINQFKLSGFHFAQNCIWNKQQFVMTRKDYHYKHEPIIYGWKKGQQHNWYTDRKQTSVWNFDRPFKSELHPTMKPIALVDYAIKNSSKADDLIIDFFGGSGSTLIACEQTNRTCYMMELDPKYTDVIRRRYWKFVNNGDETGWEEHTPVLN